MHLIYVQNWFLVLIFFSLGEGGRSQQNKTIYLHYFSESGSVVVHIRSIPPPPTELLI